MAEKKTSSAGNAIEAIDVMYFPPARSTSSSAVSETRCHEPVSSAVALKKECGLDRVFVTDCKRWSCDQRIYCGDVHLDDVLRYTLPYPEHFVGIAGYNPFDIGSSTHQAELAIKHHGFRGLYVHPGSFGISLNDRRMYPLYVKTLEWGVPVILDLRLIANETHRVRASEMEQVAADFPELNLVVAQWTWTLEEILQLVDSVFNLHFCFDTAALRSPEARTFVNSVAGGTRCMWGSNGLPWQEALAEVARLQIANPIRLLRENAVQLFGLDRRPTRKATPFVESEESPVRLTAE
jgi:uncharacterized protein